MGRALVVNDSIIIPGRELIVTHARSAGPGGQNVNKVNTKAVLRWQVAATAALPDDMRRRFLTKYATRINGDGELVLTGDEHREQSRNLAACRDRLQAMVLAVVTPPRRRRTTKPTKGSVERRIEKKQRTSAKKQSRSFRGGEE